MNDFVKIVMAGFHLEVDEVLTDLVGEMFDHAKFSIFDGYQDILVKAVTEADFIIVDPATRDEINRDFVRAILQLKRNEAVFVVITASDNAGQTSNEVLQNLGVRKMIRMPISDYSKLKEVIIGKLDIVN
jgi:hypothetical protein